MIFENEIICPDTCANVFASEQRYGISFTLFLQCCQV